MQPSRFAGKVGVVTAAAGGIGSATARAFAVEGAHVVLVDINDDVGSGVCQALLAEGLAAEYRHCDVSRGDEVAELFGIISAQHDRI